MHPNAEILNGIARGQRAFARLTPHEHEFTPLELLSSSALHALLKPGPGVELQGKWEFKLDADTEVQP